MRFSHHRETPAGPRSSWLSIGLSAIPGPALVFLLLTFVASAYSQSPDGFNPGANNSVLGLAVQADGKVVLSGSFTVLGGTTASYLSRLNADGSVDTAFNASPDGPVNCVAVQPDGKVLAGGAFTALGGLGCKCLGRLNADGSLDTTFNAGVNDSGYVYSLALQLDGKLLVAGGFSQLGGLPCSHVGRMNPNGTLDTNFNSGADSPVLSLAIQPDGKVLAGGVFTELAGQACAGLGRLNTNGTLDTNFVGTADSAVNCLALQPDGKVLVGGNFTTLAGSPCAYLGRLNTDGTLDEGFYGSADGPVNSLAVQADGRILVGGSFATVSGQPCTNFGRISADGFIVDTTVSPAPDQRVLAVAIQGDGNILLSGDFQTLFGQWRNHIGRLTNTLPATQSLTFVSGIATWLRGSASPEVWNTTFDFTTNGTNWTSLGSGTRISGGWQVAAFAAPANASIRARGYLSSGRYNGSASFVETIIGPAVITRQPGSVTADAGSSVSLGVQVGGSPTIGYQWRKDGVNLTEGPGISGTQNATLVLANVLASSAGGYSVVVTNSLGGATSTVATLTVRDPVITRQPASAAVDAGSLVSLTVQAGGTPPLGYQWSKDGVNLSDSVSISGTQDATLVLTDVLGDSSGAYSVVVTNSSGSATSTWATLTVRDPVIIGQPVSQEVNAGQTGAFEVTATGTPTLQYQWRKNTTNYLAGQTNSTLFFVGAQGSDNGNYDVIVSSSFGMLTSTVATLKVDVATADGFDPEPSSPVFSVAVQPDGKLLAGGQFTNFAGTPCNHLGRLNSDGSLDTNFIARASGVVYALALQPDGKVLAGGIFTNLDGQVRTNLGRLNADGSLDTNFTASAIGSRVSAVLVQADGKILVGGIFNTLAGQPCTNLGRLNPTGALDTSFNAKASGQVYSLAMQPDGKLLVGGSFAQISGQGATNIARLNADGSLDTTFAASANGIVDCIAVQADGRLLVGGTFTQLDNYTRNYIGRFNTNGTLDLAFSPDANSFVLSLVVQADGSILAGGQFTRLGGQLLAYLGRLSPTGTADTYFDPNVDNFVYCLGLQADGAVLAGGNFKNLGGQPRNYFGRLSNTSAATQSLACDGTTATWLRGGSAPEVWHVTFDSSTDGTNWTSLGSGARVAGGWQLNGLTLSNATMLRARGAVCGGYYGGSAWFVQATAAVVRVVSAPQPTILVNDGSFGARSNRFGFNVTSAPGQVVVIEATTDFVTWTPVQTNLSTGSGLISFSDPQSRLFSRRFYRARLFTGTLPSPAILAAGSSFGLSSNQFGFNLSSIPGQVVVIEATTDFLTWTPVQTNLSTSSGLISFSDPQYHLFSRRFYRARLFTGTLPPPAILSAGGSLGFQDGAYGFNLSGTGGQTVVIQASTNLLNWVPLVTNVLDNNPLHFSDPASTNFSRRFYRALVQ